MRHPEALSGHGQSEFQDERGIPDRTTLLASVTDNQRFWLEASFDPWRRRKEPFAGIFIAEGHDE
jgi:hypothetical protein